MKIKHVLIIATVAIFVNIFRNPLGALIFRSERIDGPAFRAMMNCIFEPIKKTQLNIGDHRYTVPLPDDTAKFGSEEFLTPTASFKDYIGKKSKKGGWILEEQLGALYIFKHIEDNTRFSILVRRFTAMYYCFCFTDLDRSPM